MTPSVGTSGTEYFGITHSVKLVIWDLDDTLWDGTIGEGPVVIDPSHANVIRELNRRGIVNSICSKNEHEVVMSRLIMEDDLWNEFVFPRVSWEAKGPQIAQLVKDVKLRAEQILFIDDNDLNRQEAKYFVPGIQTAGPEIIEGLLAHPSLRGGNDSGLNRLKQYKQLEQKTLDRVRTGLSNEEFLRSCDIRVEFGSDCLSPENSSRILELMQRTNQLNFTKRRLSKEELLVLLEDSSRTSRYVRVHDRFGDYGLCGFYSEKDGKLSDFLFSCRILNMGVEQWIYESIGRPTIELVGEVASDIDSPSSVDWINVVKATGANLESQRISAPHGRVLLKGACDLVAVNDFLGGSLDTEFNTVTSAGLPEHRDHTEVMRRSNLETIGEYGWVIDYLPFLDRSSYQSAFVSSPDYDIYVLSVLSDYTQGLYRFRDTDFVVPFGVYDRDITDLALWESRGTELSWMRLEPEFVRWFAENFTFLGPIDSESFKVNIRWLADLIPSGSRLVLVNGTEIPVDIPTEETRHIRHREMNRALDEVARELPQVAVLDVREFITDRRDLADSPRRYRRRVYLRMAESLREIVETDIEVKRVSRAFVLRTLRRVSERVKRRIPKSVLVPLGKLRRRFHS